LIASLPPTLLGALQREVETWETRYRYYAERPSLRDRYSLGVKKQYQNALATARRSLALFEAGVPPRLMPGAGSHELRKSPAGLPLCRWCSTEVSKRRTFCGELCVHEWKLRSDAGYARKLVFERDAGKCALCPVVLGRTDAWEMDHIIPVVEGGGCCGLENLRLLCPPCHRGVTAELARRRADQRRGPVLPGIEEAANG
jgi:5-methylcytosine-specific restriction endonuclease McrA